MCIGQMALGHPLPRPRSEPAARAEGFLRPEHLEAVARILVEEALDALPDVVEEGVGGKHPEHAGEPQRGDPDDVQAGHEDERAPDQGDQHGLPEIGLEQQRHDGDRQQEEPQRAPRHVAPLRALREGPGRHDHEGGLHEFRGLQAEGAELDPAVGALDLGAELGRQHAEDHAGAPGDEGEAAHAAQGQEGDGADQQHRRDEIDRLAVEEVEGRQADALGYRRAAAHQEDEAGHHQAAEGRKQAAVDGPPPIRQGRAFRAGHHGWGRVSGARRESCAPSPILCRNGKRTLDGSWPSRLAGPGRTQSNINLRFTTIGRIDRSIEAGGRVRPPEAAPGRAARPPARR